MDNTIAFIRRNARPLDFLLFEHSYGRAEAAQVLTLLGAYQNVDGGFGWAIEPDNFSEASTPMGAWKATTVLREVGCFDRSNLLVARAVDYLLRTRRPDGFWEATAPSTADFPHAQWWQDTGPDDRVWGINPTAAILGYLLRVDADVTHDVDRLIVDYVDGVSASMHDLLCGLTLHDDLLAARRPVPQAFTERLRHELDAMLERDPSRWSDYVLRPSAAFGTRHTEFAEPYADLITEEQQYLRDTVTADGSWDLNWHWQEYPREWAIAENWWKAVQARQFLEFLRR